MSRCSRACPPLLSAWFEWVHLYRVRWEILKKQAVSGDLLLERFLNKIRLFVQDIPLFWTELLLGDPKELFSDIASQPSGYNGDETVTILSDRVLQRKLWRRSLRATLDGGKHRLRHPSPILGGVRLRVWYDQFQKLALTAAVNKSNRRSNSEFHRPCRIQMSRPNISSRIICVRYRIGESLTLCDSTSLPSVDCIDDFRVFGRRLAI